MQTFMTDLDPHTVTNIIAIPTETKLLVMAGALVATVLLVGIFKMKAAVLFALAFAGLAYVTYTDDGVTVLGAVYVALAVGVLWLGTKFRSMAAAKAAAAKAAEATPAPAKGRRKAHA